VRKHLRLPILSSFIRSSHSRDGCVDSW
jgi:hypothetical protein